MQEAAENATVPGAESRYVRLLRPDDVQGLTGFFASNSDAGTFRHFHPFPLDGCSAARVCCHTGRDMYFAGLEHDGKIVAFGMLRGWDDGYQVPSFGVMVDSGRRGCGWGKRILDHAVMLARTAGSPRVRLTVNEDNRAGVRLYLAAGFRETSRKQASSESGEMILVMHLDLNGGAEPQ